MQGDVSVGALLFGFVIVYGIYIIVIRPIIGDERSRSHRDDHHYRR
jgi:hypothetical protein